VGKAGKLEMEQPVKTPTQQHPSEKDASSPAQLDKFTVQQRSNASLLKTAPKEVEHVTVTLTTQPSMVFTMITSQPVSLPWQRIARIDLGLSVRLLLTDVLEAGHQHVLMNQFFV
jgi:hypothetical protein